MAVNDNYRLDNQAAIPSPFNETLPAFFRAWDNPESKDEDWLHFFSPECAVKFGGHAMRAGFINAVKGPVVDLQHNLKTCWMPAGGLDGGTEAFIIQSSIWYRLIDGRKIDADCTSYIKLTPKGQGSWVAIEHEVFMSSFHIMDAVNGLTAGGT
ncbi:uncharacterized protein A1O9_06377, partial [Exophiala aquamarina CBS 119918]